jgi:hypothetical protein
MGFSPLHYPGFIAICVWTKFFLSVPMEMARLAGSLAAYPEKYVSLYYLEAGIVELRICLDDLHVIGFEGFTEQAVEHGHQCFLGHREQMLHDLVYLGPFAFFSHIAAPFHIFDDPIIPRPAEKINNKLKNTKIKRRKKDKKRQKQSQPSQLCSRSR